MVPVADTARAQAAARRFVAFFQELDGMFVERSDVLTQMALSLLSREHLLLTGPPGTAKSLLITSVLGRILDEATGEPSWFARQFTENTVQTDLIGPINFKTLTETGRTEHFTDEGMLGAVHAFLDEVFDGRDMLLRSALNVLHERELKQGTKITRGRFECAMMASNRYLSEVLESSRETLLAFVDRIAFVSFVPRSFAEPGHLARLLRAQMGGAGRPSLCEPLSIQDLDALQVLVDEVHVSDEICVGVAELLNKLDAELNAAVRADPGFVPTRYLSTRTAVRTGRVLRAACVYDKLFRRPARALEVMPEDVQALRLYLLLSGPSSEDTDKLLAHESDPRERRQLEIVRTEREVFDRCLAKLSPISVPARSEVEADLRRAVETARDAMSSPQTPPKQQNGKQGKARPETKTETQKQKLPAWERDAKAALSSEDPGRLSAVIPALVAAAQASSSGSESARELLDACVCALRAHALREGFLSSFLDEGPPRLSPLTTAKEWRTLSQTLDSAPPPLRLLGRWLRGQGLLLLSEHASYSLGTRAAELDELAGAAPSGLSPMERAHRLLSDMESLARVRNEIMADGLELGAQAEADVFWRRSLTHLFDELALLCDGALREAAALRLARADEDDLSGALERMAPEFDRISSLDQRCSALASGRLLSLRERVLGPRVGLLVEASFRRTQASDRLGLSHEIRALLGVLSRAGLSHVIAPSAWIRWMAEALLRAEKAKAGPRREAQGDGLPDHEGYRRLRSAGPRVPCAFALAETALLVSPELCAHPASDEGEGFGGVAALLRELSNGLRDEILRFDFERLEQSLLYLENWWKLLSDGHPSVLEDESKLSEDEQRIRSILRSKFFGVVLEESAPARLALEARLLSELFPDQAERASALRERVRLLAEASHRRMFELFERRAQAAWEGIFVNVNVNANANVNATKASDAASHGGDE